MVLRRLVAIGSIAALLGANSPEQRINLEVSATPLAQVVRIIAAQTHSNIVVDPAVANIPVTVSLDNVTVADAIHALERFYGVAFVKQDGVIDVVASSDAARLVGSAQIVVQDVPAGTAAAYVGVLKTAAGSDLSVTMINDSSIMLSGSPASITRAKALFANANSGYGLTSIPVSYAHPSTIVAELARMGVTTSTSQLYGDDSTGVIQVVGSSELRSHLAGLVAQLDIAPARVLYTVKVLETAPQSSSRVGVQWGQPQQVQGASGSSAPTTINTGSAITAFVNRSIPIGAKIDALLTDGTAKILATEQQTVDNNQLGKFTYGTTYPIQTNNGSLVGGQSISYYQIGVLLSITPTIGANGVIFSTVNATYSNIAGFDPTSNAPIVTTRATSAVTHTFPGESIILAGYFADQSTETDQRVPGLSYIPIIGGFFRDRAKTHTQDELTFVITPTVLAEPAHAGASHGQ